jgi:precorrin-6B methylase 2
LEIDCGICLKSIAFAIGCPSLKRLVCYESDSDNLTIKIGSKNPKKVFYGDFKYIFGSFEQIANIKDLFDLVIIGESDTIEKLRIKFDQAWANLKKGGLLVVDHTNNDSTQKVLKDFCKIKNRDFEKLDTRYQVCLIEK